MEGARFIEIIRLENILSYGPDTEPFPLEPLNVFIGLNGSGKSNLIEALSLLRAAPRDIREPIVAGGGVGNWRWKGDNRGSSPTVEVTLNHIPASVKYMLAFTGFDNYFGLARETLDRLGDTPHEPLYHYAGPFQPATISLRYSFEQSRQHVEIQPGDIKHDQSVLSQKRDIVTYPEITILASEFERMRFYRDFDVSRESPARMPQRPDLPQQFLLEDLSNLSLVLSDLLNRPLVKDRMLTCIRELYPSFTDIQVSVGAGAVQIFFHEKGLSLPVPAARLSDGSLRFLCLLAILCHPDPAQVICIEEPEIGLHPDAIPEVAKLLVEASSRSQIFVTTHSDILVDALTEVPEAVIICEKPEGSTQLRRLEADELKHWLTDYGLGQLWTSGEIGGTRW